MRWLKQLFSRPAQPTTRSRRWYQHPVQQRLSLTEALDKSRDYGYYSVNWSAVKW